jgi:large subunit ribosomal protein L11
MAKAVTAQIKVQITAGQATPAPPVGTSLGPHGINLGKFVQEFNEKTRSIAGTLVPVIVTIYSDRSFEFIVKTPPAAILLKQAAQVAKGSGNPGRDCVGVLTRKQIEDVATLKLPDMNTESFEGAVKCIMGAAKSCGIRVE